MFLVGLCNFDFNDNDNKSNTLPPGDENVGLGRIEPGESEDLIPRKKSYCGRPTLLQRPGNKDGVGVLPRDNMDIYFFP